jgi:hypothetical protein
MPSFLHPELLPFLGLLAVPLVIHLINLVRHRRVPWAAMEFLLESKKKNSRRILLEQILLLLMRLAAVAAIVFVLAQPFLADALGRLLGGARTHHFVLLDDSFSMGERTGDGTVFDRAKRAVAMLAERAALIREEQTMSVARTSRIRSFTLVAHQSPVNSKLRGDLEGRLAPLGPSPISVSPADGLRSAARLLEQDEGDERIVYLVSDFRTRDWDRPDDVKKTITELESAGIKVHFIDCSDLERGNLAVASLAPLPGTRAAEVPVTMEVEVANHGSQPARSVSVVIETRELDQDWNALPSEVLFDEIPPGKTGKRRFSVLFQTAGEHQVAARLKADAVEADNVRFAVVDVPLGVPVLAIEEETGRLDGYFLVSALSPPGPIQSGIETRVEAPSFLKTSPLDHNRAVYLLGVDTLELEALDALASYVRDGGGLGIFMGPMTASQIKRLNETWVRGGEGIFPAPLAREEELRIDRLDRAADLVPEDHPVFRVFAGERNSFLGAVLVNRYLAVEEGWEPAPDSGVRVIARLRNQAPFALEKRLGKGRIIAVLSTAAPDWNNWAKNPSFVVAIQEMQGYLGAAGAQAPPRLVGAPLDLTWSQDEYEADVRVTTPNVAGAGSQSMTGQAVEQAWQSRFADTETPGVYEARLTKRTGGEDVRRFAYNVDAEEGRLASLSAADLAGRLKGLDVTYQNADRIRAGSHVSAAFQVSDALLYVLIALLLAEQLLAYTASHHPPKGAGAAR